ncbi:MAG: ATP-binding protein [Thermoplasmata archaeon]
MSFYVLIRGPLGVGKTTVAKRVAQEVGAEYISIDRILDDEGLWDSGRVSEFLDANAVGAPRAREFLEHGTPVIFDGNFYWQTQIADLTRRLNFRHRIFTLDAPLSVCVERDARRDPSHGREAAEQVFVKATRFDAGIRIDATRPLERIVSDIVARLRKR